MMSITTALDDYEQIGQQEAHRTNYENDYTARSWSRSKAII